MRDYLFDSYLIIYLLIFSINRYLSKAGKGTRTLDLLITNQLRYQLRHAGIKMTVRFELTNKSFADSRLRPTWQRHQYYKTECKGFEPLCRDTQRWISNPVQLTCSANTPEKHRIQDLNPGPKD